MAGVRLGTCNSQMFASDAVSLNTSGHIRCLLPCSSQQRVVVVKSKNEAQSRLASTGIALEVRGELLTDGQLSTRWALPNGVVWLHLYTCGETLDEHLRYANQQDLIVQWNFFLRIEKFNCAGIMWVYYMLIFFSGRTWGD